MKKTEVKPNMLDIAVGEYYIDASKQIWKMTSFIPEPQVTMLRLGTDETKSDVVSKFKNFVRLAPVGELPKPPRNKRSYAGKPRKNKATEQVSTHGTRQDDTATHGVTQDYAQNSLATSGDDDKDGPDKSKLKTGIEQVSEREVVPGDLNAQAAELSAMAGGIKGH